MPRPSFPDPPWHWVLLLSEDFSLHSWSCWCFPGEKTWSILDILFILDEIHKTWIYETKKLGQHSMQRSSETKSSWKTSGALAAKHLWLVKFVSSCVPCNPRWNTADRRCCHWTLAPGRYLSSYASCRHKGYPPNNRWRSERTVIESSVPRWLGTCSFNVRWEMKGLGNEFNVTARNTVQSCCIRKLSLTPSLQAVHLWPSAVLP